jgi:hypothetical protein
MATARSRQATDGSTKAEVTPEQIREAQFAVAPFLGDKQRLILSRGMCAGLSEDQREYFYEVVERTELDPFQGQIWPSIRHTKDEQGQRIPTMFTLIKLQGFRAIGDRSGLCDGESPVEWCGQDGEWKEVWLSADPPYAARASVYRKDRSRSQTMVCLWVAFVQNVYDSKGSPVPNAIWKRMGPHMLGKCALAGAYRGAFPRQASGVYLIEELGGDEASDPESEASIEAEMTRRAIREANYWQEQRKKGVYPLGEKAPEEQPPPPEPSPEPAKEPLPASVIARQEALMKFPPAIKVAEAPELPLDPRADWRTFPISRIKALNGKAIGELTESELLGVTPWLEKVENNWGSVDNDIRAHYHALKQRLDNDRAKPQALSDDMLEEGLFSGPVASGSKPSGRAGN